MRSYGQQELVWTGQLEFNRSGQSFQPYLEHTIVKVSEQKSLMDMVKNASEPMLPLLGRFV